MSTPSGVNYLLHFLIVLPIFGDFGKEQESKVDVQILMSFFVVISAHGQF